MEILKGNYYGVSSQYERCYKRRLCHFGEEYLRPSKRSKVIQQNGCTDFKERRFHRRQCPPIPLYKDLAKTWQWYLHCSLPSSIVFANISTDTMSNTFTTTDALAAFPNTTLWSILGESCYAHITELYKQCQLNAAAILSSSGGATQMVWHDHACRSLHHELQHALGWPCWSWSQHNLPHPCRQKRMLPSRISTPWSTNKLSSDDVHWNHPKKPPLCCH